MFALLLAAVAHADELPLPTATAGLPYRLTIQGTGKNLNLTDPRGHRIDLETALEQVGRADQIDPLHTERLTRNLGSIACWVVGGGMIFAPAVAPAYLSESVPSDTQLVLTAGGLGLIGGGFLVRFVARRNDLGDWVDATTITTAVEAHNARFIGPSQAVPGQPPLATVPPPAEWALHIDADGRVRDYQNRAVTVPDLAKALRDQGLADEYAAGRRMDKAIYFTTLGAGGAVAVASLGLLFYGFLDYALVDMDRGESIMLTSLGTGALGGLAVGGGVTGLIVSKKMRSDPRRWFDEPTLRQKVDAYNAGLGGPAAPLPATQPVLFEIHPLIGPGMLGVSGSF